MKRPDIEGALARAGAATQGPWEAYSEAYTPGRRAFVSSRLGGIAKCYGFERDRDETVRDAVFIAAARTDVPDLAAYALALEALLRECEDELERHMFGSNSDGDEWTNVGACALVKRLRALRGST
jgi:hypothetical protein